MTRLDNGHEIVEDAIRYVLVEDALIAESLEIQFEALQLHAQAIRHVPKGQNAKIGCPVLGQTDVNSGQVISIVYSRLG